jgi:hypothetical protein
VGFTFKREAIVMVIAFIVPALLAIFFVLVGPRLLFR